MNDEHRSPHGQDTGHVRRDGKAGLGDDEVLERLLALNEERAGGT